MARHKQTIACDIDLKTRRRVLDRDGKCCVLCGRPWSLEIAHYIGRAQGGLGIPQNLVTLCKLCHAQYDDGGFREEYKQTIHDYLKGWYPKLDEMNLKYDKYGWLNEAKSTTKD